MKSHHILLALAIFSFLSFTSKEDPAVDFINTLSKTQKAKAVLSFDDARKTHWHYLPHSMFPREGIAIKELEFPQKVLLAKLLESFLSKAGYETTLHIIDLENVLAELSGDAVYRDAEKYYITFYGNPEKDVLWAWSFEGHHISLNFTVSNGQVTLAPRFFGANPAIISHGERKGERSFKSEEDLALQVINGMTTEQRTVAIFRNTAYPDVVTGNSSEVSPMAAVGIKFDDLDEQQQKALLQLIEQHLSYRLPERTASIMQQLKENETQDLYFGWAGATALDKPHYYRIQGKSFVIELDNTQNNANHIHIVWRDFKGDFGRDIIKAHYKTSNHH